MLAGIVDMGFEVGLHFDPAIYPVENTSELEAKAREEASVLSMIVGKEVKSLSLHNPSVLGEYPLLDGFLNAYDERIFSPDRYISDSRMVFSNDIFEFVKRAENHPVQVLLHPFHYSESGDNYAGLFSKFVPEYVGRIETQMRVNSSYDAQVKDDLYTYIIARECSDKRASGSGCRSWG
jgi:hypothetical protein